MWIVEYALRRRYTVGVLAALILLFGTLAARRMPTDILPEVGIPSVNLIWTYAGLPAEEMAAKITSFSEIAILNNVDDIREVRSESLNGIAVVRIDFQPGVDVSRALTQITAVSQTTCGACRPAPRRRWWCATASPARRCCNWCCPPMRSRRRSCTTTRGCSCARRSRACPASA